MAIRYLDDLLYQAQVGPATLTAITSVMSDEEKARWLDRFTNFPKPTIGRNGTIEVRDPDGSTHSIDHTKPDGTTDQFRCRTHGFCWAAHSAVRAYNRNSGVIYEQSTGDDFGNLRFFEERSCP